MCHLLVKEVETCFAYESLERETITNPSIAYGLGPLCEVLLDTLDQGHHPLCTFFLSLGRK